MVLQLISSLTKGDYDTVATIIQQTNPLPSFDNAKSSLLLEEARRNKPDPAIPQALVTQRADSQNSDHSNNNQFNNGRGQFCGNQRGGGRWSRGGQRGGRGRGRGNGGQSSSQQPTWQ
ncbi:hypothetical protein LXL04_039026 [Taraxacum kok-saghyz]